jgi:hypothetical protein
MWVASLGRVPGELLEPVVEPTKEVLLRVHLPSVPVATFLHPLSDGVVGGGASAPLSRTNRTSPSL